MLDVTPSDDAVDRVRAFNRLYTKRIGVLAETLLGSPFSLTEARSLYEIAAAPGTTAKTIGAALGLDAGYLSRLLARFVRDGLVEAVRSDADGRSRELRLTAAGQDAYSRLEDDSRRSVAGLLDGLPGDDRAAFLAATEDMARSLGAPLSPPAPIAIRRHRPGDLGWIVERHGTVYAREYGFDGRFEALVADIVAAFLRENDPARETCLIAERDGRRLGSVMVVRADDETAKLRLLLVEPEARGEGLGRRLLAESMAFAREAGYRKMVLWTNDVLVTARRLYEAAGFRCVDAAEHTDFGPRLVGETWTRTL